MGIVNVHASLLPKYRGAGPIQWAIVNGETRTGVTTMRIDAGLDTGDMLLKGETEIGPDETAIELGDGSLRWARICWWKLSPGLTSIVPEKQDSAHATYAPILKKEDGLIDWTHPAQADPQPRPRPATLARRLHHLPRTDPQHLEVGGG